MKAVDSIGLSRGLVLLYKDGIEVRVSELNTIFISARIRDGELNLFWRIIFVYGEPAKENRLDFYDLIINKVSNTKGPLLCIGD